MELEEIIAMLLELASQEGNEWAEQAAALLTEKNAEKEATEQEQEPEPEPEEDWEGKYKKLHALYVERFLEGDKEVEEVKEVEETEEVEDKTEKSLDELLENKEDE